MSIRIGRSTAGIVRLPLLRVQRTGDLHEVREISADVTMELTGPAGPGADARMRVAVETLAATGTPDPELLALAIARDLAREGEPVAVHVDLDVHRWSRLDIGGRPRGSDFARSDAELRTAHASVAASLERVSAGIRGLQLLAASAEGGAPLLVALGARWAYGWGDVPFDAQWQQVRRVIIEAWAERRAPIGSALAHALGNAVLEESPAVRAVEVSLHVHGYVADDGARPPEQFAPAASRGTTRFLCSVEREEVQGP